MKPIHKLKDNSYKKIFSEPILFIQFLKNFIPIDILKDVDILDIEDITERFLPLFQDNKDSDTIKKIKLKNKAPLFVIAILEHESEVNYIASFKMLQYITLVLSEYVKENDKKHDEQIKETGKSELILSKSKNFKLPPVLPIIFYDGVTKWTSEMDFVNKTELKDIFYKYIPKFEYELINLNNYSKEDLIKYGDLLSLILIMDKIKKAEDIEILGKLPKDYIENITLNVPEHLLKILSDVITLFLTKIEVPKQEIEVLTEKIYQRRLSEMFTMVDEYSVTKTRQEGRQIGRREGINEEKIEMAKRLIKIGDSIEKIEIVTELPKEKILELKREFGY